MTIPADLRTSITNYVATKVTTTVGPIQPDVPNALSPGEGFTFSVTATNSAAPDGIKLINVRYHLGIGPTSVGMLQVPPSPPARSTLDPSAPPLAVGSFVQSMYLFPTDKSLDVGDTDTILNLRGKALALGNGQIFFHVHADPDLTWLFPAGSQNPNSARTFSVV